ncbi:TIGR04104 family putative zinc finger protein [Neobacillus ginsengisoli]|uniref:TIGR04104 family putative zinc finger protein n=1 Tax=Neobacillus ginsengisoli TaxID=904295 RepID=UPI003520B5F6
MPLQQCEKCRYKFKWREIQKSLLWGYKPLICKKCGLEHRINSMSRYLSGIFCGSIMLFYSFYLASKVSFALGCTLLVLLCFIDFLIFPYFTKYKAIKDIK